MKVVFEKEILFSGICLVVLFSIFTQACQPELDSPYEGSGQLDFSNYVAIGGNLSAGYHDQGISSWKQENSIAALLANQFQKVDTLEFNQALLGENEVMGQTRLLSILEPACTFRKTEMEIEYVKSNVSTFENVFEFNTYNDLSVPELFLAELELPAVSVKNEYLKRMLPALNPDTTFLDLIHRSEPTFFSISLGLNDVLNYALNGGVSQSGQPIHLMKPEVFEARYRSIIENISTIESARGVLLNIPYIHSMPYISYINRQFINDTLCDGSTLPIFITSSKKGIKAAEETDFILLSANDLLSSVQDSMAIGLDSLSPLGNNLVLDEKEMSIVSSAVLQYNFAINRISRDYNLPVFDLAKFYETVAAGVVSHGLKINNEFIYGGFYSTDGTYPTTRGNAMIANEVIRLINRHYHTSIPEIDITAYSTVRIP